MSHPTIDQQVTFLYTRDLESSAKFYEEVLGLDLVLDQGSCRIYRISESGFLGFCQREEVTQPPKGIIFTLVTTAVDDWYEYLRDRGVVFDNPPELNTAYNIYHCFLRDPNGYVLEIQQFLDPTWPV